MFQVQHDTVQQAQREMERAAAQSKRQQLVANIEQATRSPLWTWVERLVSREPASARLGDEQRS
jgi:gentisate 1,2-dioxygenase